MKRNRNLLGLVLMCTLASCSPVLKPFTVDLQKSFQWSETELKKLQFYVSSDIVLYKSSGTGESEIKDGVLTIKKGNEVDQVIVKAGTPGVLMFRPKDDRLAVSFEQGNDSRFLVFGPSKYTDGRYALLAAEWNKNSGKVTYGDETFTTPSNSALSHLVIDMKKINKSSYKSRSATGRKID